MCGVATLAEIAGGFFVWCSEEGDVTCELFAGCVEFALEEEHRHQIGGEHPFVVDCAAAVDVAVANFGGEWVCGPLLGLDANDVCVGDEHNGGEGAGAANGRDDGGAHGRCFDECGVDSRGGQGVAEMGGEG